jgi:hypothetical protein
MNIVKLRMPDLTGLSGMEITHMVQETKDGFPFMVPTTAEPPYPVHLGLIKKFKELSVHLLNICDICQDPKLEMAKDYAIVDTEVTEITMNPDHFILKGHRKMGDKILPLKTYKVAADDYLHFAGVQEIFKGIREETEAYCAGNRQITIDELGERYINKLIAKGKKDVEELAEFQEMSDEDKKEYCRKYLMANGAIDIVMQDEVDVPVDTPVLELNQKTA